MNEQTNRDRLAQAVKAARLRKFKTVDSARIAAGVARGTWDNVEHGKPVKEFSLAAIEEALDWPVGHALAMLRGDEGQVDDRLPGRLSALIEDYMRKHPRTTDEDIAGQVGVSRSTVSQWRRHRLTELPTDTDVLRKLAEAIDVDQGDTYYAAGVDTRYIIEVVEPDDGSEVG